MAANIGLQQCECQLADEDGGTKGVSRLEWLLPLTEEARTIAGLSGNPLDRQQVRLEIAIQTVLTAELTGRTTTNAKDGPELVKLRQTFQAILKELKKLSQKGHNIQSIQHRATSWEHRLTSGFFRTGTS
jgi:hypothetical protein